MPLKPFHDEISRRGGLSRSPAKMQATAKNLAKARQVLTQKRQGKVAPKTP
jgi:hypothetical protein